MRLVERARYARSLPEDATTHDEVTADLELCVDAAAGRRGPAAPDPGHAGCPASLLSQPRPRRRSRRRRALVGDPGVDRAV